jgi:hypothetical protein
MKKIIIVLLATILLASCGHKESHRSAGKMTIQEQTETAEKPADDVPPASTPTGGDGAYRNSENSKDERTITPPVTLSLASIPTTGTGQAEKEREEPNTNTAVIKNQIESKEPSQIIRNANVNFQVDCTDSSHAHIAQSLSAFKAYFGSDRRSQNSYQIAQTMVIRVPMVNFDKLMDLLMKESVYTDYKDITADDVTAEFVDIQTRLRSKKEVEKRYMELLSRAQMVNDILEVESNLRIVREEIEATEGRLKLLKDRVAYSTITLTISQKLKGDAQPEVSFGYRLKRAIVRGWRNLEVLALRIVSAWPYILIISPFIVWIILWRRKRKAQAK